MASDALEQELLQREVARTTESSDPVVQRALLVANQPLNPVQPTPFDEIIKIYEQAGSPMSIQKKTQKRDGLGGFRLLNDPKIYVNQDSIDFNNAKKNKPAFDAIMASILLHEQVHNTETGKEGEFPAHRLQADFLKSKIAEMDKPSQRREVSEYADSMEKYAQMYEKANLAERKAKK